MAHPVYFDHNYHIVRKSEDETNEEDDCCVVASTSTTTTEAAGGHSEGAVGCACGRNNEADQRDSDSEDSDDDLSESSSDPDSSSSSSESEQEEPSSSVAEVIPIPPRRYFRGRRRTPFHFTQWQVEEMENLFEETQYPDVLTMEELARVLNVPEIKVKVWFVNRRAKQRKDERRAMLRNMPPGVEDFIFITDVEEPS
ncbi:homeobox protein Rhox13-like [Sigmodon hispidus]